MIHKIQSKYILQTLFSYISENKMLKLIRNNNSLIKKLDLSIDYFKEYFYLKKIEEYDWFYINDYYIEFYNDFSSIIENDKIRTIFLNLLSKNNNFVLNILDNDFDDILKNEYFKDIIRINLDGIYNIKDLFKKNIPRMLLIKNNKLIDKVIKIFKDIFNSFSTNGKMNKIQCAKFINSMMNRNIPINENNEYVNKLFSEFDINKNGLSSFEDFNNFFLNLIKNQNDSVWKRLYLSGYNNLLEKNKEIDYTYILNHEKEFEKSTYTNIMNLSNEKIYKLSLFNNIDTLILQYFNENKKFENLKKIDISIYNLNQMVSLNITCPYIEELNLKIIKTDLNYNIYEWNTIFPIFPNMTIINLFIETQYNLFNFFNYLRNSIENLKIYIEDVDVKIYSKITIKKIILKKIKNLEIEGYNYNINNFLCDFFNNIELPNLQKYIINTDINNINNQILISNNNDYNIINQFIIDTLNNKNKFDLKSFFSLSNRLNSIKYLQLNFLFFLLFIKKNEENIIFLNLI